MSARKPRSRTNPPLASIPYASIKALRAAAAKHAPKGWTLDPTGTHPVDGDGYTTVAECAVYADGTCVITHPPIVDRHTLYVFLHECGHVHCGHMTDGYLDGVDAVHGPANPFAAREEMEAELYAQEAMRAANIPVPVEMLRGGRIYVGRIVEGVYAQDTPDDARYAMDDDAALDDDVMEFVYGKAAWRGRGG